MTQITPTTQVPRRVHEPRTPGPRRAKARSRRTAQYAEGRSEILQVLTRRIRGFAGQPLVHRGEVLGVLALFARGPTDADSMGWLRMMADHAAAVIAMAPAFAEIEALKKKLELEDGYLPCRGDAGRGVRRPGRPEPRPGSGGPAGRPGPSDGCHGPDPGRGRHRQGTRGPGDPPAAAGGRAGLDHRELRRGAPQSCSTANSSGTPGVHSPGPCGTGSATSSWPIAEPYSSTRPGRSPSNFCPSCCASFGRGNSRESGRSGPGRPTCGSSRRPTATCGRRPRRFRHTWTSG